MGDLQIFAEKFKTPSTEKDYSRWDLNGDGYTGGRKRKSRFNLNMDFVDGDKGQSKYESLLGKIHGFDVTVAFHEEAIIDEDILCYYLNIGNLFKGDLNSDAVKNIQEDLCAESFKIKCLVVSH